jgi:general secretion pathway protein N
MFCMAALTCLAALLSGMGRGVHWRVPSPVAPLPAPPRPTELVASTLDTMKVAWERPLFEPTRRMASVSVLKAQTPPEAKLAGLVLTGTVLAGSLQVALIKDAAGKDARVPVGGNYQGWVLVSLESRRAAFRNGEATDEVIFPAQHAGSPGTRMVEDKALPPSVDAAPQPMPMMTREAMNKTPPSEPMDDAAARQARLEAMKDMVARRRAESSDQAGGR